MVACQTELTCLRCGAVTSHTIVYASLYMKRIICSQCSLTLERQPTVLVRQYFHDLPARAHALTLRLKSEALSHPVTFTLSLPRRAVHKPIELTREFVEVCL